ncbi:MAG: alanine racemase [Desulfobacteraceae bacterium]|nr:MAG: alanine racemase [Desulfobacteraceae bacterium]
MQSERVTKAIIDLEAIRHNVRFVKQKVGRAKILAAVKADAYGHGAVQVSQACLQAGAEWLGVATVGELAQLREAGVSAPILLFNHPFPQERQDIVDLHAAVMVFDVEDGEGLCAVAQKAGRKVKVHLKVNTGMERLGCPWEQAAEIARKLKSLEGIELQGLCTHFPISDIYDKSFTNLQIQRLQSIVAECKKSGIQFELVHAANSGAILDIEEMPGAAFDMVRPGIMLYGYPPSDEVDPGDLKPAMELQTRVVQVRPLKAGTPVGYGHTYRAKSDGTIAVIPAGYADGYNRQLSNRGKVWINGKTYTISGRVCMDLCMIDVGQDPVRVGDEVVLMGQRPGYRYTANDMAHDLNTIPYEVTCWVSKRVKREFVNY